MSSEHVSNLQYLPIGRPSQFTYHNFEDQWYHDDTYRTALSYASDVKHHPIPKILRAHETTAISGNGEAEIQGDSSSTSYGPAPSILPASPPSGTII